MTTPSAGSYNVLSASGVMAAGTLISRITGFVRAGMLAAAIGLAAQADTFNIANTIPNSFYILIAGGVFNTVLVPQLVRAIKNDPDGGDAYANRIVTLGGLVLAGVTTILVLLTPQLLQILVDESFYSDPERRQSLITLTRLCLPQIFFYGMYVLIGQILNARGRFGPMMWAPIANNVISIAVIGIYLIRYSDTPLTGSFTTSQEVLLGLGSTLGIIVQAAVLLPYLKASGFRLHPRFDFLHTGLSHTLKLGMWTVGFVIVNQLAFYVMVHRSTAGSTDGSGFTVYANAFLFTQVPHSIVTVSLATATMPLVSRLAAEGLLGEVATEMAQTLRLVLSLIVPFAIALIVLGPALATVLFSWGQAAGDTKTLGWTLMAFAPGLLMFSVHYVILRGFYADEDTRTPFFIQCLIAAVNISCAIWLTAIVKPSFVAPALALAYGASYSVGALVSLGLLSKRLGGMAGRSLLRFVVRVVVASIVAAGLAWLTVAGLEAAGLDVARKADSLVLIAVGGLVGITVYIALARLLRITEIGRIVTLVASRGKRG